MYTIIIKFKDCERSTIVKRHLYTCPIGDKSQIGHNILGFTLFQDAFTFLSGWYHEKLDDIVLVTDCFTNKYGEEMIDWISIPKKHYNKKFSKSIIDDFNSHHFGW